MRLIVLSLILLSVSFLRITAPVYAHGEATHEAAKESLLHQLQEPFMGVNPVIVGLIFFFGILSIMAFIGLLLPRRILEKILRVPDKNT